jgi:hypothetical protein
MRRGPQRGLSERERCFHGTLSNALYNDSVQYMYEKSLSCNKLLTSLLNHCLSLELPYIYLDGQWPSTRAVDLPLENNGTSSLFPIQRLV